MTHGAAPTAPAPVGAVRRAPRPGARGAHAATAVLHAACVLVLYAVCVRTTAGQAAEDAVHRLALREGGSHPGPVGALLELTAHLDPPHLVLGLALVALAGLLRRSAVHAALGVGTAVGTLGITELLKLVVLQRPDLVEGYATSGNSLPSGHTSAVLGLALGLLAAAPHRWRVPLGLVGALLGAAMAAMVVDDGWHRVSDPLASALVASAVFAAAHALPLPRAGRWVRRPTARGPLLVLALVPPALCVLALVAAYLVPGAGLTVAVLAPAVVVAVTVLAAAATRPREERAVERVDDAD